MNLKDNLLTALRGLRTNKLRSALTVLGIVVGIAAVIALVSLGRGAENLIVAQLGYMGTNLLIIRPGSTLLEGEIAGMNPGTSTLTLDDAEAIANPRNCPWVTAVSPEAITAAKVTFRDRNMTTVVSGGTPEHRFVYSASLDYGESLTWEHVRTRAMVCVLGHHAAEYLFQGINPLGHKIKINGRPFKVIGVFKSRGGMVMSEIMDDAILIPITTAQSKILTQYTSRGKRGIQAIYVRVASESKIEETKEQITNLLRQRHRLKPTDDDDFTIISQQKLLGVLRRISKIMTMFLSGIAAISLLVGGIGIMNIMFVSVRERTREIGIRRAVGARRRDILLQFLTEAIILSLIGGMVGVLIGCGIAWMASLVKIYGLSFSAVISPGIVVLAFSVAASVGLIFGLFPAARAAQLNPIDALRYE